MLVRVDPFWVNFKVNGVGQSLRSPDVKTLPFLARYEPKYFTDARYFWLFVDFCATAVGATSSGLSSMACVISS